MSEVRRLLILTSIQEPRISKKWQLRTDYRPETVGGPGWLSNLLAAFRLLHLSKNYDAVVIASNRSDNLFLLLSTFLRRRTPPVIVVPCIWELPKRRLLRWIKGWQFWLMGQSASKLVVWCNHEVSGYSAELSLPREKFVAIPHHHTLEGYDYSIAEGDYIFSGGDGHRDYATLIRAVENVPCNVVIATRRKDIQITSDIPPHVEIKPTSHEEFRHLMAGSRLVVLPMESGHIHVGAEQTYLNAMAMGKPVIVTDLFGAPDYIEDGVNGLIVRPGDANALTSAIESVLNDPQFAIRLASNARKAYDCFSTPKCMERILSLAEKVALLQSEVDD